MAWPEDIAKYKGKYSAGCKALRDARYKKQLELGLISKDVKLSELRGQWSKLSAEEKAVEERTMEVYAAMIDRVDQNIGRVLAKVKELGRVN